MSITLAFDVYGTLIDTQGIVANLYALMGDKAHSFSKTWRDKQLEYSFRRGLMETYQSFSVCISNALDYTCELYAVDLTNQQKRNLLECYRSLPTFNDVEESLQKLTANNYRLFAFSNGTEDDVDALLVAAGIRKYFIGIVSVDNLKTFKPNPAVYNHFLTTSESLGSNAWLISSNSFDVIGAISAGMRAAWVKRSNNAIFDPWGIDPTITIEDLNELPLALTNK